MKELPGCKTRVLTTAHMRQEDFTEAAKDLYSIHKLPIGGSCENLVISLPDWRLSHTSCMSADSKAPYSQHAATGCAIYWQDHKSITLNKDVTV